MIKIFHNPKCGTSRNVLAMIKQSGSEVEVIEYLKTPPSRDEIKAMVADAGISLRDAIRQKGTPYDELGLDDPALDDENRIKEKKFPFPLYSYGSLSLPL